MLCPYLLGSVSTFYHMAPSMCPLSTANVQIHVQKLVSSIGTENWNSLRIWVFSGTVLNYQLTGPKAETPWLPETLIAKTPEV